MPRARHKGREAALQYLYRQELSGAGSPSDQAHFWGEAKLQDDSRDLAEALVNLVRQHQADIDAALTLALDNWRLDRLSVLVRGVLRLAVAELRFVPSTPPVVVLDEAIELARDFVDEEASRFVNGVLDKVHRQTNPA